MPADQHNIHGQTIAAIGTSVTADGIIVVATIMSPRNRHYVHLSLPMSPSRMDRISLREAHLQKRGGFETTVQLLGILTISYSSLAGARCPDRHGSQCHIISLLGRQWTCR